MADYTISYDIAEEFIPEMIEIYSKGWEAEIEEGGEVIPNPISQVQHAKNALDKRLMNAVNQDVRDHRKAILRLQLNENTIITKS